MGMVQPVAKEQVKGTDMFPSWARALQKRHARQVRRQGRKQGRKLAAEGLIEMEQEAQLREAQEEFYEQHLVSISYLDY